MTIQRRSRRPESKVRVRNGSATPGPATNHQNRPGNKVQSVLVIDIGGTNVKVLATGQNQRRKFESGPNLKPKLLVSKVRELVADWKYDVISVGYPGRVLENRPVSDPRNLGAGWVGFDFQSAFERPVKVLNDAAMQALGSYIRSKLLFLGLGTGLGSAAVADGTVEPMELGRLPYKKGTFEDYVGVRSLEKNGKKKWRRYVTDVVELLIMALEPEDVVLGGGNVRYLDKLPRGCRGGDNANAFVGGFRLWEKVDGRDKYPCVREPGRRLYSSTDDLNPAYAEYRMVR